MMSRFLKTIFGDPLMMFLVPYFLSFSAWLVPQSWYGRYWTLASPPTSIGGFEYMIVWFMLMCAAIKLGSELGKKALRRRGTLPEYDLSFVTWYHVVSVFASIGLIASIVQVSRAAGFGFILQSLTRGTGNNIHDTLYAHYSAGVGSLRYLTIISGGVGLFLLLSRRGNILVHLWNLFFMVVSALISSRLSLVASAVVFLVLYSRMNIRLPKSAFFGIVVLLVTVLTVANVTRNKNYYVTLGVTSPLGSSLSEALTYLGSPFQGTIATMDMVVSGNYDKPGSYWSATGIDPSLTTDSANLDVINSYGSWGSYILLPLACFVFAALFSFAYNGNSLAFVAGAGAWGYAFCEIWRVCLFDRGIFWVLFIFGFFAPIGIGTFYSFGRSRSNGAVAVGTVP